MAWPHKLSVPCKDYYPCQTPAKPETVCLDCGWVKESHPKKEKA